MIEIQHHFKGSITISDPSFPYDRRDYVRLLESLTHYRYHGDLFTLRATGIHLERICEHYQGIPKPVGTPSYGFMWTGAFAELIVNNICLDLEYDTTVIVDTPGDYNFNWHK